MTVPTNENELTVLHHGGDTSLPACLTSEICTNRDKIIDSVRMFSTHTFLPEHSTAQFLYNQLVYNRERERNFYQSDKYVEVKKILSGQGG